MKEIYDKLLFEFAENRLEDLMKSIQKAKKNIEAFMTLKEASLDAGQDSIWDLTHRMIQVDREDLVKYRKVLGPLKESGRYLSGPEEEPEVRVYLRPTAYPNLTLIYGRPYQDTGRCRIVEEVRTERVLVCKR